MKKTSSIFCLLAFLFLFGHLKSQVSFTLVPQSCQNQSLSLSVNSGSLSPNGYTWTSIPNGAIFSSPNTSASVLSFTSSGIYTISILISSSNGTTASSKTISVIPYPIIALSALSQTNCFPFSASLSVSGANTYTWFPTSGLNPTFGSSVVASPSISTVYSVTGSSSICGTSSITFSVAVHVYPLLSFSSSAFSLCVGQTATLSAFGALNYTWLGSTFSTSVSQSTISVSVGTYTLIGSNGGSCTNTLSPIPIYSLTCTGVEESENEFINFKVFPNPVSKKLFISSKNTDLSNIVILDVLGKVLLSKKINFFSADPQEIDLSDLPANIYYVRLRSVSGSTEVFRLIKE